MIVCPLRVPLGTGLSDWLPYVQNCGESVCILFVECFRSGD